MDIYNTDPSKKKIYSVSDLNREAKNLLTHYFSYLKVEGEISNLSSPSSGHIYFSLKDKNAQIRCAMFKSQQRRLGFKPENGMQVIISAQVSLYEARGDYQLIADKMQEAGAGNLQIAFEHLKSKLQNEGLFDPELKQDIPEIPHQIGIITSPSGAAIHDILSVLSRRFPTIPVIIYPTTVQGDSAKRDICKAIETANQQKLVDVILLARGGGSIEDLWSFNEESVARAIANSSIPIISGIGHEVDFTIADFVADLRAPTPSAAAESCVPDQKSWLSKFQATEQQLNRLIQGKLLQQQQAINWLLKRLQQQHPKQQFQRHAQTLDNLELRLVRAIQSKIKHQKNQLENINNCLHQHSPANRIIRYQQQQQYLNNRLNLAIKRKLDSSQRKYQSLAQTLNAVSPLATLERGYAIVSNPKTSKVIGNSQQLAMGDTIKTRLAHGHIISQIKDIQHE